jgi:hypothetical protein
MSTATIPAPGARVATGVALAKIPRWFWGALALLFAGGILAFFLTRAHAADQFNTAAVTQGTLASGTIAAIEVDYNSKVKRG